MRLTQVALEIMDPDQDPIQVHKAGCKDALRQLRYGYSFGPYEVDAEDLDATADQPFGLDDQDLAAGATIHACVTGRRMRLYRPEATHPY